MGVFFCLEILISTFERYCETPPERCGFGFNLMSSTQSSEQCMLQCDTDGKHGGGGFTPVPVLSV